MKSAILLLFAVIYFKFSSAQQIQLLTDSNKTSLRGLSPVNDKIIWVSGSNGTVGKSINGGSSWEWMTVKNFETKDFRDIEAFDEKTAIIMAVAEPAYILKTKDGGITWKIVFADSSKGMFLDAMDFADERHGVVIGDPIDNNFFIAHTENQADSWKPFDEHMKASDGEALFASSGTNIKFVWKKNGGDFFFVTGGKKSRLFAIDYPNEINIIQGESTQGANSIALDAIGRKGVIVGGDFSKDTVSKGNCVLFSLADKKHFLQTPAKPPFGYKSCVEYITQNKLICCGTSGVDVSEDGGNHWRHISSSSFHVCKKAKNGKTIFFAGINGKIARLNW